jgi:hypothetical protein
MVRFTTTRPRLLEEEESEEKPDARAVCCLELARLPTALAQVLDM